MRERQDPCDPKAFNGIACTCATYEGLAFSVVEFGLYLTALILYIVKNRKNENKKGIYVLIIVTAVALCIHAV